MEEVSAEQTILDWIESLKFKNAYDLEMQELAIKVLEEHTQYD